MAERLSSRDEWLETLVANVDPDASPTKTWINSSSPPAADSIKVLEQLAEPSADVGRLVFGDTIGRGGMGLVRLATQVAVGRAVAVKSLRDEYATEKASMELLREAWLTGALEHPNIVPIHDIVLDENKRPLVVLKRIDGKSWATLMHDDVAIREELGREDHLTWNIEVLLNVCNAIRFAHSHGIIHRDIKPENVMVGNFGEVYVVDWGLAASLEGDADGRFPTVAGQRGIVGTPAYMAPEMLGRPGSTLSERTDIYLLGAVLYEIIGGRPPHQGKSLPKVLEHIAVGEPPWPKEPAALVTICQRALAHDADDRYASAEELRADLQAYLVHRSSAALADDALVQLDALRAAIADDTGDAVDELYTATRFGFRAALASWPENEAAANGLEEAVTIMVNHELAAGDAGAAKARLAELTSPPADLVTRVASAVTAKGERDQRLEEIERDLDPVSGRHVRLAVIVPAGVIATITPLLHQAADAARSSEGSTMRSLWVVIGFVIALSVVGAVFRKQLSRTLLNRRLFQGMVVAVASSFAMLSMAPYVGLTHVEVQVAIILLWATIATMFTFMAEWRFWPCALAYTGAFVVAALRPEWRFYMMSVGHASLAVTATIVWSMYAPVRR